MANLKQTYLASDQMDYRHDTSITKADANKGVAVYLSSAATASANRPEVKKNVAAISSDVLVGALGSVGDNNGCNVIKRGRFILQANTAFAAANIGKSVAPSTVAGKVAATTAVAKVGDLVIIGDATDAIDGIGHAYLCEY